MKVALYQMNISWEDKEKNYAQVEKKIEEIKKEKIDLFLLPEMSFTGFSMNTLKTKEADGQSIQKVKKIAQKYQVAIGFGWVKDCGLKAENHYTIIDYKGEILSDYTKIHPFSYSDEDKEFKAGNNIAIFSMKNTVFSSFICYDLRFPEIFQIVSRYAHIVIIPANWPAKRNKHWKCLLQARAIENQIYILAINCVGQINDTYYSGDSCIINPDGERLKTLADKEGVLFYDLQDDVINFRESFPVKNDRREDFYLKKYKIIGD